MSAKQLEGLLTNHHNNVETNIYIIFVRDQYTNMKFVSYLYSKNLFINYN